MQAREGLPAFPARLLGEEISRGFLPSPVEGGFRRGVSEFFLGICGMHGGYILLGRCSLATVSSRRL